MTALRSRPLLDASVDGTDVAAIGNVRAIETLQAPLSGKPCVAYHARIVLGLMGGSKPREQVAITSFVLERADGSSVTVESPGVQLVFPAFQLPVGSEERCLQFAKAHAVASGDRGQARYEEVVIVEGMKIAVGGRLVRDGDVTKLVGDDKSPIIIGVPF